MPTSITATLRQSGLNYLRWLCMLCSLVTVSTAWGGVLAPILVDWQAIYTGGTDTIMTGGNLETRTGAYKYGDQYTSSLIYSYVPEIIHVSSDSVVFIDKEISKKTIIERIANFIISDLNKLVNLGCNPNEIYTVLESGIKVFQKDVETSILALIRNNITTSANGTTVPISTSGTTPGSDATNALLSNALTAENR